MYLSDWPSSTVSQNLPRLDTSIETTGSLSSVALIGVCTMFVLCFLALGHDWDRSLRADDDYNVTEDVMQERAETGETRNRLAFLMLGALGAVCFVAARDRELAIRNIVGTLMLTTYLLCLASVLWTAEPATTLRRLVPLTCTLSLAVGLGRALTARQMCILAFIFTLTTIGIGLALELVLRTFQPWDGEYRFAGVTHPNTTGIELSVLCISGYLLSREFSKHRLIFYAVIAVATLLLLLTKSRTSVACTVFRPGGALVARYAPTNQDRHVGERYHGGRRAGHTDTLSGH